MPKSELDLLLGSFLSGGMLGGGQAAAEIDFQLSGAVTATTATVTVVTLDGGEDVRVGFSTSPGGSSPSYTSIVVADGTTKYAKCSITGLSAATTYYYFAEIDGVASATISSLKTPPTASTYTFTTVFTGDSELDTDAGTVYARMAAHSPDLAIFLGDNPYMDNASNNQALYRTGWDNYLRNEKTQQLLSTTELDYAWDDHDFAENGSQASSAGAPAAKAVYRQLFPHHTLPDSGAIYHSYVKGRVLFVMLDTRSERITASNQMISATQMAWFKTQIDLVGSPSIRLLRVNTGVPWISSGDTDTWFGAQAQRTEIADYIQARNLAGRVQFFAADAHMIAFDDGTNNTFDTDTTFGWPMYHAAPANRTNSTKGGPYSGGTSAASNGQYGRFVDVDDGDEITTTFNGYNGSDSVVKTHTMTTSGVAIAQTKVETNDTQVTSIAVTPDKATTSGNLLLLIGGPDKTAGSAISVPAGFSKVMDVNGAAASISGVFAWKVADGTESGAHTLSWTNAERCGVIFVEVVGPFVASPLDVSDTDEAGTSATSLAVDAGNATVTKSIAISAYYNDSVSNLILPTTHTNGFAEIISNRTGSASYPGQIVGGKSYHDTSGVSTTIGHSGSADQSIAAVANFELST